MAAIRRYRFMRAARRHGQRGVVLFISLIVMVAMARAGIALVRQVDSGVLIAGNLAFKQRATLSADQGLEAARTWLLANTALLNSTNEPVGYYSFWQSGADLAHVDANSGNDFDWNASGLQVTADDGGGNRIRYVIHRLCDTQNVAATSATCVKVPTTSGVATSTVGQFGGLGQSQGGFSLTKSYTYYRITVRVDGPRNTVSYVQGMMY